MKLIIAMLAIIAIALSGCGSPSAAPAAPADSPDPPDGAFPSAEVLHVVSQDSASRTTETWIDRISGDVVAKTTDQDGNLHKLALALRRGTASRH